MTENLRLTLSTSKTLTNADTNLATKTSWTPDRNTQNSPTGAWVADWNNIQVAEVDTARSYVSSTLYQTTDEESQKAGGYYNWYAATAGSGNTSITGETEPVSRARDSICPKGWIMPMAITHYTKSLDGLAKAYGYNVMWDWTSDGINVLTSFPISLLGATAGQYNPTLGIVIGVEGGNTEYWMDWGYVLNDTIVKYWAQVLSFEYTGQRYVFAGDTRAAGFFLRCVNGW